MYKIRYISANFIYKSFQILKKSILLLLKVTLKFNICIENKKIKAKTDSKKLKKQKNLLLKKVYEKTFSENWGKIKHINKLTQ